MQYKYNNVHNIQNSQNEVIVQVQVHSEMLTREEKYTLVSMNSPRMPDLSGMRDQYTEAIAKAKRFRTTTIKTRMGVIYVHGPEDNSIKTVDSIVDDAA